MEPVRNPKTSRSTSELSTTPERCEAGSEASGVCLNEQFSDAECGAHHGDSLQRTPVGWTEIVPLFPKRTRHVRMNTCGVRDFLDRILAIITILGPY